MGQEVSISLKRDLESADDATLALLELQALTGTDPLKPKRGKARNLASPNNVVRSHVARATVSGAQLEELRDRLAFWSEIRPDGGKRSVCLSQVLENTVWYKPVWRSGQPTFDGLGDGLDSIRNPVRNGDDPSPNLRRKNEYLSHPFHKYKAKFFPRLARSLINITTPDRDGVVLDPFCGSGTTCLEASLMGMTSIGFDIDPLSVEITRAKTALEGASVQELLLGLQLIQGGVADEKQSSLFSSGSHNDFKIPQFLVARNPHRLPAPVAQVIEQQVSQHIDIISKIRRQSTRTLLWTALSHAIATKISLRWMGTGDDRFALELAHRSVDQIIGSHLRRMIEKVAVFKELRRSVLPEALAPAIVAVADAISLPLGSESVDAIVTSPPYLPAASGRETYLRSRAASLVALGLMTEEEVLRTERNILGTILAQIDLNQPVPEAVRELVDWMRPQRERAPKAIPTLVYFQKLARCLAEMRRVLKRGARAAIVVSKEHTFWALTTRKVHRRFNMANAVTEIAVDDRYGVGLKHDGTIELELPKMDFAARPGARGTYSEAIIFLRKP